MIQSDVPALTVRNLHKRFAGGDWVVRDVSLEVRRGELLCILGPSGCGKTTLLRLVGGFEEPERGEVLTRGEVISRPGWVLPPEERKIGMVFQDYALFPHLRVRENVRFGLVPPLRRRLRAWLARSVRYRAADPTLRRWEHNRGLLRLTGLSELAERYPHELSGGQQQRVALARALATRPHVILLDEPFSNQDTALRQRIREDVRRVLHRAGTSSILVTHDQEEAVNVADRLAIMNNGRLEQLGTPEELLHRPQTRFVAQFLGRNSFLPGKVRAGHVCTELGDLPLPAEGAPGERVEVLVRPGQVVLAGNGHGAAASVRDVQYLHGYPLYTLALPSGAQVQALLATPQRLRPGDRAMVTLRPEPPVLFPAT